MRCKRTRFALIFLASMTVSAGGGPASADTIQSTMQRPSYAQISALSIDADKAAQQHPRKPHDPSGEAALASTWIKQNIFGDPKNSLYQINSEQAERDFSIKTNLSVAGREDFLRVSQWNIAQGAKLETLKHLLSFDKALCQGDGSREFELSPFPVDKENVRNRRLYVRARREACELRDTDILVLNEVDMGVCRSAYASVAEDLAKSANMNFAFAPEFVELEPKLLDPACGKSGAPVEHQDRLSNLTGNAVLSRFPIRKVRVVQLQLEDCYDAYEDEIRGPKFSGRMHDLTDKTLSLNWKSRRQIRFGQRNALFVDVELPGGKLVTVVNTHLENHASGECRSNQMKQVMASLASEPGSHYPVVLAGDLSTYGADSEEQTLLQVAAENTVGDGEYDIGKITSASFAPLLLIVEDLQGVFNHFWISQDPTHKDISTTLAGVHFSLINSPDGEIFEEIAKVALKDDSGQTFSFFRKENEKKYYLKNQLRGAWSATNSRIDEKLPMFNSLFRPFEATHISGLHFATEGKYRLDWIFVANQGEFLKPAQPDTLNRLREIMGKYFPSDHTPITVLLKLP
jgi:endonuclease/exonuclease/phosphatase family metal-dependent hydrolase